MGEVTKVVGAWIANNVPWAVLIGIFIFCLFFEISKIKIYPLRWLWKGISWPVRHVVEKADERRVNVFKEMITELKKDVDAKFDDLEKRFDRFEERQTQTDARLDAMTAARIKNHVLNFARQCRKGEPHSHEDFANLFKENKEYEALVTKYGWENDVYIHDFAYIVRVYDECNDRGFFDD